MENLYRIIEDTIHDMYEADPTEDNKNRLNALLEKIKKTSEVIVDDGIGLRTCSQINVEEKYIIRLDEDVYYVSKFFYNQIDTINSLTKYTDMETLLETEFLNVN